MASEFRQHLRQVIPDGNEQQQFEQETGINIERDIDSVTAAFGSTADNSGLFLIRGAMNPIQVVGYLLQHGGVEADYKGKQVVRTESAKADGGAVGFLDTGLIALGSEAAVHHAIDGGAAQAVTANADMMRLINDVEGRQSTVWAVGRLDKVTQTASLPQAVQEQASAVQWFSVTGDVDGGVSGVLHLEARDDKAAENLRSIVNGGLALARLQMGKDSKLDSTINSLQLSGTGKDVSLAFTVPAEMLDVANGIAGLKNLQNSGKKIMKLY